MPKSVRVFSLGFVTAVILTSVFPLPVSNTLAFLGGGGVAKVKRACDLEGNRCVFVREEGRLGINDVTTTTIWPSAWAARRLSFSWGHIACDPAAFVAFDWEDEGLIVVSEDGGCDVTGRGDFGFSIRSLRK